jgi:sensor histidine kinase YesM
MGDLELRITRKDWLSVLLIGVSFSTIMSVFAYYLIGLSAWDGAIFGIVLGFFITTYSLIFISAMNRYLLPRLSRQWWNAIAAVFSFFSGFLGTLGTHFVLHYNSVTTIDLFAVHPYETASIIGILTYLIGALMYRFVKTRNEKEHIDRLFIDSRVRSLETQLNPHFLFNALNSLAELIHQDTAKAEETVLKISTFLRNTMTETPLILLDQELKNVRDYIELENIRFRGLIDLRIDCGHALERWKVPKFSIQLLCENAIKHSMQGTTVPFSLTIDCRVNDTLHIRVSNNGKPITSPAYGIGLSNLQERLAYLCQGTLTIESFDPPAYLITLKEPHEISDR